MVDVLLNASRLTDDDLYTQLWRIAKVAEEGEKTAEQVGILTSWKRNKWAATRNKLLEGKIIQYLSTVCLCDGGKKDTFL